MRPGNGDSRPDQPGSGQSRPPAALALEVDSLSKSFGPVQALREVSFKLRPGEVLGLLGDNGAGKTTLVNCISGVITPSSGSIRVDGRDVNIDSPEAARALGIETVHQHLALVEFLNVSANLFLNREIINTHPLLRWLGLLRKKEMHDESDRILSQLRIRIPSVEQDVSRLSGGQRQAVAVGRAVGWGRHIVLMDKPIAALGVEQARHVLELVETLKTQGVAVLFISHNMQQIVEICDRAIVLRHGGLVGNVSIQDVTPRDLVDLITGATPGIDPADQ
jgi:simple sugar transport system ATP-binding protein